jgi:Flp pilus assembly protein TadG
VVIAAVRARGTKSKMNESVSNPALRLLGRSSQAADSSKGASMIFIPARTNIARWLRHFSSNAEGNVVITFALTLVPIMGLAGAAVDYGRAGAVKASLQAAVDGTALALGKSASSLTLDQLNLQASQHVIALFKHSDAENIQVSALYSSEDRTTRISANAAMKTALMKNLGISLANVSARAAAGVTGGGKGCVLALSRTASSAIAAQGSTSIKLQGCSLHSNSGSGSSVNVGGSATIAALTVEAAGGISGASAITAPGGIFTGVYPVADPYSKLSVPYFSGCSANNLTAKTTVTLEPGVYCGGIQLNAGAVVTLNPGIYVIDRGNLLVNGGAVLKGAGVTLVFTSSTMNHWADASINGGAEVALTPPTSGPFAGVVIYGDRNIPVGTSFKLSGGASQYLGGAVYIPTGALAFAGGAAVSTGCTQLIGDTVSFDGNADLAIDCSSYGTKPFGPAGVRLLF